MPRLWTRLWTTQLLLNPPPDVVQLPAAILEIVLDTPSSVLGLTYRRYIKTAFLPGIGRVAELLRAHSATIEVGDATNGRAPRTSGSSSDFCTAPSCAQFAGCGMVQWPSLAWLKEKYPKRSGTESADWHAQQWLAYIRSWDTLLAAWAEDDFTTMWFVPPSPTLTYAVADTDMLPFICDLLSRWYVPREPSTLRVSLGKGCQPRLAVSGVDGVAPARPGLPLPLSGLLSCIDW